MIYHSVRLLSLLNCVTLSRVNCTFKSSTSKLLTFKSVTLFIDVIVFSISLLCLLELDVLDVRQWWSDVVQQQVQHVDRVGATRQTTELTSHTAASGGETQLQLERWDMHPLHHHLGLGRGWGVLHNTQVIWVLDSLIRQWLYSKFISPTAAFSINKKRILDMPLYYHGPVDTFATLFLIDERIH